MEYIYSAMLLHKAGKEINESNINKVLESAGIKIEEARVKALVSALDGVNIDQAIKEAAVQQIQVAQHPEKAEKKEEKKAEDEEKKAEEASAGLGSLFG